MANRIPYRPYQVSRNERLVFRFKAEPIKVLPLIARRRYHNSALMEHEQTLRYHEVKGTQARGTTTQYHGEERVKTVYEM